MTISQSQGLTDTPRRERDEDFARLGQLIQQQKGREIGGRARLPKAIKLSVAEVIRGLFPENRFLMLANRRDGYHQIRRRDVWLSGCYQGPTLETCSFVSQNYCCRSDVDGTSYDAFEGIERRWLVIEADQGSLEEQFWIHKQLKPTALCWSGGKSLHGWYFVEGWTTERCFELYAKAIQPQA